MNAKPRWAVIAGLVGLTLLLVGIVVWWVFIRPGQHQDAAAVAKADATIAAAAPEIARDAMNEVDRTHALTIEIRERAAAGNAAIMAAPGAAAVIPPDVAAAGRRAVCMHQVYRDDPGCAALP